MADALAAEIVTDAPWLQRPAFRLALAAWSVAEAKAALVDDWLDEHGLLDDDGNPRPATALSDRLHGRAQHLRASMGLDPLSFARLLATFSTVPGATDELELLKAEGRRLVEARSAALTAGGDDDTGEHVSEAETGAQAPEIER